MPIAYNEKTGEAVMLTPDGEWVKTQVAENKAGEKLAFDGESWQPIERRSREQQQGKSDTGNQALRAAVFASRGFLERGADILGAVPELAASGLRMISPSLAPEPGYYPEAIKSGLQTAGRAISAPINALVDFGPAAPQSNLERGAYGVGGGLADAGAFLVPGAAVGRMAQAGSLPARVGQAMTAQPAMQMAAGAVGGGVAKATDSELLGLASGVGTALIAAPIIRQVAVQGATNRAERRLLDQLKRIGDGDATKGAAIVKARLNAAGKDAALVDVLDIHGQKMARAAANVPGESAQLADEFIQSRMAGRGERYQEAADIFGPRRNIPVLEEKMDAAQKMAAQPHYEAAFKANLAVDSPAIERILQTPAGSQALKKAATMMQNDRQLLGAVDPELTAAMREAAALGKMDKIPVGVSQGLKLRTLDYVKRALGDMEQSSINSGEKDAARIIGNLRRSLTDELDRLDVTAKAGPIAMKPEGGQYAMGRAAYAGVAREKDALELGMGFMRGDADVTAAALAGMAKPEKEAVRMGARKALGDMIRQDRQAVATRLADKKDAMWDRIRAVFPEKDVNEFKRLVEIENSKLATERFIGPRVGSQTAGLQQDIAELNRIPESAMLGIETLGQLASGHPFRAVATAVRPLMERMSRPDTETAGRLSRMLLETDPQNRAGILANLLAKQKQIAPQGRLSRELIGNIISAQQLGYGVQ